MKLLLSLIFWTVLCCWVPLSIYITLTVLNALFVLVED
jgi:hypothetical protein